MGGRVCGGGNLYFNALPPPPATALLLPIRHDWMVNNEPAVAAQEETTRHIELPAPSTTHKTMEIKALEESKRVKYN